MISIELVFYLMTLLFGGIGAIRGWQKEVIAMAGLIGSVAFLHSFGSELINYGVPALGRLARDATPAARQAFWVQFVFHVTVAFFSYQVIGAIADRAPGTRNERVRAGFQSMFIGFVIGVFNGYLLFGTLWSFLEYQIADTGYTLIPDGQPYAFGGNLVQRVATETIFIDMVDYLPMSLFGSGVWLLFFFVSFFIVIIALI